MGQPVQIVRPKVGRGFELDGDAVRKILLADNVKDKPAVVISVAGVFRTGKSFLLNFFLRFLRSSREQDSLSDRHAPLEGFSWRGGSERHTTGIWLWNEAFLVKRSHGDEVAVLLMDTHGMFDSDTALEDCLSLFFFSASVSSVQLYNLTHNIQEDDLQRLQTCVNYGRMALAKQENECLFQNLLFLVRDWNFPSEAPYGEKGGKKLLNRRLRTFSLQPPELKNLHDNIGSAFSAIGCFLLPHPGRQVATATSIDGGICEMEDDFRDSVKDLVRSLLEPDKLVLKIACGRQLTCEALASYIEYCMEAVSARILHPTSTLEVCGAFKPSVPPCHLSSQRSGHLRRHCFVCAEMKLHTEERLPKEENMPNKTAEPFLPFEVGYTTRKVLDEIQAQHEEVVRNLVDTQRKMTADMLRRMREVQREETFLPFEVGYTTRKVLDEIKAQHEEVVRNLVDTQRKMNAEMLRRMREVQDDEHKRTMEMIRNLTDRQIPQDLTKRSAARRKESELKKRLADGEETRMAYEEVEPLVQDSMRW